MAENSAHFILKRMLNKIFWKFHLGNFSRIVRIARWRTFDTSTPEGRSMERHRKILLNTSSNFLARGFSLAVNLLVIRLVLGRFGKEEYGLWIAITAFVVWTTLLDFGILNGLVNAISESFGKQDRAAAINVISTAFFSLIVISIFLAVLTIIFVGKIHWGVVFASKGVIDESTLRWSIVAALAPFIAGIPLSVVRQIYSGFQKAYIGNVFIVLSALVTLVAVLVALGLEAGLPWLVLATGIGAPVAALGNLVYLVKFDMPWLAPRWRCASATGMRRLLKSSAPLFLLQSGALLVNYSQPILLAHVASYSVVADYSLLIRLYGLIGTIIVLATSSFFPAFREAFERGDHDWVRRNFFRMVGLRMLLACSLGIILFVAGNAIMNIWLGQSAVGFLRPVWMTLAVILIMSSWGTAFSDLLTIMDRIWIQVGFVLLNGVAVVLLTVWFAPRIGVLGALVAYGCIPVLVWSWAGPILSRSTLRFSIRSLPPA